MKANVYIGGKLIGTCGSIKIDLFPTPELDKINLDNWLEVALYSPLQQSEINDLINNHIWITARKVKFKVNDMETSHIQNCINCLEGRGKSKIPINYLGGKEKWLKIFNKELLRRQ